MDICRYIDHAVLAPELALREAREAIELGAECRVATVCVRPVDIPLARAICVGTDTEVSTVLAFPHGTTVSKVKRAEARAYIAAGAAELDMVLNYSFVRSGEWRDVRDDILSVVRPAREAGVTVKVILETCKLTDEQIREATLEAIDAGADYVKTSTGFAGGGATVEAVRAMLEAAGGRIKVKASGGIRSAETALRYIEMGVQRLGVGYAATRAVCSME